MGNKSKISMVLFRILEIFIVFIVLMIICVIAFLNINRMKGTICITVNGENYLLESLECEYIGEGNEKISYDRKSSGITFKNHGSRYGMYEYTFSINKEALNEQVKIRVFKTNWWEIHNIDIDINAYEENGIWKEDITVNMDDVISQETFFDINNKIIELRVE